MNTEQAISTIENLNNTLGILEKIKLDVEYQVQNLFLNKKALFNDGTEGYIVELFSENVNLPYDFQFLVRSEGGYLDYIYEVKDFVQFI